MKRIVVLISGRGSNLKSLLEARLPGAIVCVISNYPDAPGLAIARAHGVAAQVIDHRGYAERSAFDRALAERVASETPDLIVLAGFMRVLTEVFLDRFPGRVINIHPSLLPAFAGVNTHRRALEEGVKLHGCTVHLVTASLDHGPIIIQAAVPVLPRDDEASLAARVLEQEHRILPQAVRWFLDGKLTLQDGRVSVAGAVAASAALISPPVS